jgi:hypothetical protein
MKMRVDSLSWLMIHQGAKTLGSMCLLKWTSFHSLWASLRVRCQLGDVAAVVALAHLQHQKQEEQQGIVAAVVALAPQALQRNHDQLHGLDHDQQRNHGLDHCKIVVKMSARLLVSTRKKVTSASSCQALRKLQLLVHPDDKDSLASTP